MKQYTISHTSLDHGILQLTLTPIKGGLKFRPGQYAALSFRGRGGRISPSRTFSITSAPVNNGELKFGIRVAGNFTQTLADLPVGSEIMARGPFGDFSIDERYDRRIVMLAGGIGITPFMSMIRSRPSLSMSLLYSYPTADGIPFYDELQQYDIDMALFVTQQKPADVSQISGRMTDEHYDAITSGSYRGSSYFVCGPATYMATVESELLNRGVATDRIITESFAQSSKDKLGEGYALRRLTYGLVGGLLVTGVISIAALDLSRYVPKVSAATSTPPTSVSAESDDSATTTPATPSPAAAYQPQSSYQAPMSSVS